MDVGPCQAYEGQRGLKDGSALAAGICLDGCVQYEIELFNIKLSNSLA